MIKCNVTVCGTIGRNASARTNKEGNSFLSFPLRVTIPDRDGQNEVIEISVSKDGSQEEASGYRNGSHVEITGTLFLKRRGDKLYFNLFADRIDPVASDTADFLKGDMAFRGKVGKNIEERKDRNDKPYTRKGIRKTSLIRCSRRSVRRRSMTASNTSGCASSASTGNAKSGCNRVSR